MSEIDRFETVRCPVCDVPFGRYNRALKFKTHCDECRATYWWSPLKKKPLAILDQPAKKKCGCGTCQR